MTNDDVHHVTSIVDGITAIYRTRAKPNFIYVLHPTEEQAYYPCDAQHSAVFATATWLAGCVDGWLAGCLSHAGIVSKWLNLS